MPSDGSLKTSCYDEYVYYDDDADDGGDDDDGGGHDDDDVDSDVMTLVMVRSTAVKMMMKARGRRRKPEEYGGVGRRIRNRLVDFQGARAYCRPFGRSASSPTLHSIVMMLRDLAQLFTFTRFPFMSGKV